jgi:hypothetical protein
MANILHPGDLVRANINPRYSDYKIGVVLEIVGENIKIALPHPNSAIRFSHRIVGDAFIEPLTDKMVTDGLVTEGQMNEAHQFKNQMEQELNSSKARVVSRVKGGRKKTNKKRKSNSSRSKKRRHRKSQRTHRK